MIRFIITVIFMTLFFTIGQITLVIGFFISLFDKEKANSFYRRVVRFVFDTIVFISGADIETINKIDIDKKPCMIIANHRSFFDVMILYHYINIPCAFIAKDELEKVPLLGLWMKKIGCLFLERDNLRQQFSIMLEAINNIKNGFSYVIFPEGTRNKNEKDTDLLDFKDGSFILTKKTDCYIYPIALSNTVSLFEKQFPKIRKNKVKIIFNEPIKYSELTEDKQNNIGLYFKDMIKNELSNC